MLKAAEAKKIADEVQKQHRENNSAKEERTQSVRGSMILKDAAERIEKNANQGKSFAEVTLHSLDFDPELVGVRFGTPGTVRKTALRSGVLAAMDELKNNGYEVSVRIAPEERMTLYLYIEWGK